MKKNRCKKFHTYVRHAPKPRECIWCGFKEVMKLPIRRRKTPRKSIKTK